MPPYLLIDISSVSEFEDFDGEDVIEDVGYFEQAVKNWWYQRYRDNIQIHEMKSLRK
jgi:hypothetical protein